MLSLAAIASALGALAPSPSLAPLEVVEAQLVALRERKLRDVFSFASPTNRRTTAPFTRFRDMIMRSKAYFPLIDAVDHEVISALHLGDGRWRCRVRISAHDRGGVGALRNSEFQWELSKQAESPVEFDLGQCMTNQRYGYRGVIIAWDDRCQQPDEWCELMDVDSLPRGRDQPFYSVLVDSRDRPGAQVTYVAQENVAPTEPVPIDHPRFGQPLFTGEVDDDAGVWRVNPLLHETYPRGVHDCWMVDAVLPDDGARAKPTMNDRAC